MRRVSLSLVGCLLLVRPLQLVVLVFAYCGLSGIEFTLFGGMLVVSVTVTISRSGFRLL